MTHSAFFDFLETASWALLVTGGLVVAYVVIKRMKSQMEKGKVQAEMAPLDEVSVSLLSDGQLRIQLSAPEKWNKAIRIAIELESGDQEVFQADHHSGAIDLQIQLPAEAKGVSIDAPGQRMYKRIQS
jgi:hypothetical protein